MADLTGLFDFTEADKSGALNMGLLQAGLGILANNTDRNNPMKAIGTGGMQGLQGYQQALDRAQKQKLMELEKAKAIREILAAKRRENTLAKYPQLQEYSDLGILPELFKAQKAGEGETITIPGLGMMGGAAPVTSGMPEQLSGPGMGSTPAATGLPAGVIAQGGVKQKERTRFDNDQTIQEEWTGSGWREIGRGPRFAPEKDLNLEKLQALEVSLPPGQRRDDVRAMIKKLTTHAPASNQNVTIRQETAFEGALGKGQAEDLIKGRAGADDARQIIDTVNMGRKILKDGMITGAGANFIIGVDQALKTAGINFGGDASANSQAYVANMAQNVGKLIKQFGAGTGLSDADREYATKMAGGAVNIDEKALKRILDINETAARNVIKIHNERAGKIKTNIPLTVDAPPSESTAPPSISQQIPGQLMPRVRKYNAATGRIE